LVPRSLIKWFKRSGSLLGSRLPVLATEGRGLSLGSCCTMNKDSKIKRKEEKGGIKLCALRKTIYTATRDPGSVRAMIKWLVPS
ncbi:hypothetical protein L249_6037, partial [Ophiocordyceps polyrhachis-furcata BCC 54312]